MIFGVMSVIIRICLYIYQLPPPIPQSILGQHLYLLDFQLQNVYFCSVLKMVIKLLLPKNNSDFFCFAKKFQSLFYNQ